MTEDTEVEEKVMTERVEEVKVREAEKRTDKRGKIIRW